MNPAVQYKLKGGSPISRWHYPIIKISIFIIRNYLNKLYVENVIIYSTSFYAMIHHDESFRKLRFLNWLFFLNRTECSKIIITPKVRCSTKCPNRALCSFFAVEAHTVHLYTFLKHKRIFVSISGNRKKYLWKMCSLLSTLIDL